MSLTTHNVRRIAMFGTTQGSGLEAMLAILRRSATAQPVEIHTLVRNTSKLHAALTEAGFDVDSLLDNAKDKKPRSTRVFIHQGDALQVHSVCTFFDSVIQHGPLSDVVSSIGAYPVVKWQPLPTLVFPKGLEYICADSMKIIVGALETVVAPKQPDGKVPSLLVVSANAIGQSTYDALPMLVKPLCR